MWSLYENSKQLKPLVFSNGKTQEDVVTEVLDAFRNGHKIVFIRGMCGTGKSAIALNLAANIGKTSIVVPIKSLQEQYSRDYSDKMQVFSNGKRLSISPILGRKNFRCRYLDENNIVPDRLSFEKDARLSDLFNTSYWHPLTRHAKNCDNNLLPCKIEIKEKNLGHIMEYLKKNKSISNPDSFSISDVSRMSIAPVCSYWSPIIPSEFESPRFNDSKRTKYRGLNNREFHIYSRSPGCKYYEQYLAYASSDVLIFNSSKYILESLMNRKPLTDLEIFDECDEFLDSFSNQEQISINRLLFSLSSLLTSKNKSSGFLNSAVNILNTIRSRKEYTGSLNDIFPLVNSPLHELLDLFLKNIDYLMNLDSGENSYIHHAEKVALEFKTSFDETFFSVEKKDNDHLIHLVTTDISKKLADILGKNKLIVMMSGTIHSESVLKNIFGITGYKIIDAEVSSHGQLTKVCHGAEFDCKYDNFQRNLYSREDYLRSLSSSVRLAKRPTLVHVTSYSDLPTDQEKSLYAIDNLITQTELYSEQENDPLSKRVQEFKDKKRQLLFTTKCSRGIDFPGEVCNSIVITRYPYPNISSVFWRILRKNKPLHFSSFYMDKAKRELLQKVYRGLRSSSDKVQLLSPDKRVLDFEIT